MQARRRVVVYLRLLFRGVAHRRGIAALIFVVAVVASAAAAVAPTYKNAAALSAMRSRMVAASADASGVGVSGASSPRNSPDQILAKEVHAMPLATSKISDITIQGKSTQLQSGLGPVEFAAVEWRQNECEHVVFVQGHCPTTPTEMALPVDAAKDLHAGIGSPIVASELDEPQFGNGVFIDNTALPPPPPNVPASHYVLNDKVVGLFTVPSGSAPYWFGRNPSAPIQTANGTQVATVTALVTYDALSRLPLPIRADVSVDQPIDWSGASLADVAKVESALRTLRHGLTSNLSVQTSIPALDHANQVDQRSLGHLVTLAQLQLLLLIGLVLISILAASMDRRRAELVIATLQGRHPARTAISVAAEPVVLLLAGIVPGLILSIPLAVLASHLWLRAGTPVSLSGTSIVAALIVTLIAAVVTVAIGFVAAARSLNEQLTEDARAAAGRSGAWIDTIAMTLAAAGLVELLQTHSSNSSSTPWSLLAPSLCGLAVGIALGRAVPLLLRPFVSATAHSENISGFLALRELRRDRAAWRVTAMVALALSLLTFAVTVSSGATSDRQDRAGLIVGAQRVATVSVPSNVSLIDAVDKADPHGKWAMAARIIVPFGSASQRNLSIDTSRLPAVAGWSRKIGGFTARGLRSVLPASPEFADQGVPVVTAGDVEGEVFGFNNETLPHLQIYGAKVLPQLLNEGSLTDLRTLTAAAPPVPVADIGTTQITDQVWLGKRAPSNALKRLEAQGITITSVQSKAAVANQLERLAETAGLSGYLAVAIIAAILAVALLLGTSLAAATRQRTETLALTTAGLTRASIVSARATASIVRLGLAGAVALTAGLVTAHLAADLIPETSPHSVPAPFLPLPIWPPVVAILITLVPALLAEVVIARYAAKRADSASLRSALT